MVSFAENYNDAKDPDVTRYVSSLSSWSDLRAFNSEPRLKQMQISDPVEHVQHLQTLGKILNALDQCRLCNSRAVAPGASPLLYSSTFTAV